MEINTIGMIGLGAMGRPMSRHLAKAGFEVLGYDPVEGACEKARVEAKIETLQTPKGVARRSDFVMIVVGFESQVEGVIFGEDGILAGAKPGLIIGMGSTVSPTYAFELADRLKDKDIVLLDIPTARSSLAAEKGTLLVIGGGDPEVFDQCRPIMETFATDICNLGPFGAGQVGKLVNNMILWACMVANDEGMRFGEQFGLDPEVLRDCLVKGAASNFALIEKADLRPIPWAEKDMTIAQKEADKLRFSIPLTGQVKELIKLFKAARGYETPTG